VKNDREVKNGVKIPEMWGLRRSLSHLLPLKEHTAEGLRGAGAGGGKSAGWTANK